MGIIDIAIIVVYLAATLAIGIAYRGKQENAEDFFTASGGMKSHFQTIIVGFSIAATLFSGISFVMYPATVFKTGVAVVLVLVSFPIGWVVLRYWFLPHFMSLGVKHPYDVIERKFGPHVRTLNAVLYTAQRIGWMAILIYAPTLAIMAATGMDAKWTWPLIIFIGMGSTIYTAIGGIRGVIITDAMQFVVIALGVAMTVIFILVKLPVSMGEIVSALNTEKAFDLNFSWNPKVVLGVWGVILGATAGNIANWVGDQMSLQRYLANGDAKSACRSTASNLIGSFFVVLLLGGVGLSLAAWFHFNPDPLLPTKSDKVFPYFIATYLPTGASGLLLAAILAATISSMTSGVNTLASTITFDFRLRYGGPLTPQQQLKFGRYISIVVGIVSTIVAGCVGGLGTIFEMAQFLLGLFAGPIFVCVLLSVTKIRVNHIAMAIAMVAGFASGLMVKKLEWYSMWTPVVTFVSTFGVAVILSLFMPPSKYILNETVSEAKD